MLVLGNSRRGMKSPPLLVAGLLACVFVLGINYWITSSRCAGLQRELAQMEGRMRRAAAERGAVEIKKNEFEDKLEKQKEQIDKLRFLHISQMEETQKEKAILMRNITLKERVIQKLEDEMKTLQKNYNKLQQDMELVKESQARKLSYELTQCSNKMKEMAEQCEEKLKKTEKTADVSQHKESTVIVGKTDSKTAEKPKTSLSLREAVQQLVPSQMNIDVPEQKQTVKIVPKPATQVKSANSQDKINSTVAKANEPSRPQNLEETSEKQPGMKLTKEKPGMLGKPFAEDDPEKKAEEPGNVASKAEAEEEVERENLINLDIQEDGPIINRNSAGESKREANVEEVNVQIADYNGDDGNEAEPEAEKQAVLIENPDLKDTVNENKHPMNNQIFEEDEEEENQQL